MPSALRAFLGLVLVAVAPAAATVRRGDVLVSQPGGFVRLDPGTGVAVAVHVTPPPVHPAGAVVLPDGDLLVADWVAATTDDTDGLLLRVAVRARLATQISLPGVLANPFALVRGPDGRVVLADIDAGSHFALPSGAVLRQGALFDVDPATGACTRVVPDCCGWNPVGFVFAGPTDLLVADAGCCAFTGIGNLARVDLAAGTWAPLATGAVWRDPFGVALSADGATLFVAESAAAEPGPPAVRAVDLATGITTTVREGAPFVSPSALLREPDGRLLVADQAANAVFRLSPADGAVETLAQGGPLVAPSHLVAVDVGDEIGGGQAPDGAAATCAQRASEAGSSLAARALRCVATRSGEQQAACLLHADARFRARPILFACPSCLIASRWAGVELTQALVATPGRRFDCAGSDARCRRSLGQAAGRLYRARARCTAAYRTVLAPDPLALAACRDAAAADYRAATSRRGGCGTCSAADHQAIVAQVGSLVDGFAGAWFCAR